MKVNEENRGEFLFILQLLGMSCNLEEDVVINDLIQRNLSSSQNYNI
mgnify:FL=1